MVSYLRTIISFYLQHREIASPPLTLLMYARARVCTRPKAGARNSIWSSRAWQDPNYKTLPVSQSSATGPHAPWYGEQASCAASSPLHPTPKPAISAIWSCHKCQEENVSNWQWHSILTTVNKKHKWAPDPSVKQCQCWNPKQKALAILWARSTVREKSGKELGDERCGSLWWSLFPRWCLCWRCERTPEPGELGRAWVVDCLPQKSQSTNFVRSPAGARQPCQELCQEILVVVCDQEWQLPKRFGLEIQSWVEYLHICD